MNSKSIIARLKNYSKLHNKTHQFTVTRFFQERFLYRLSKSKYKNNFLLKGGALVYIYGVQDSRYTKDIDFLAKRINSSRDELKEIFREIVSLKFDDAIEFDAKSIKVETIAKEGSYSGTRIKLLARLENINQFLQIDIGVGDYVTPGPQEIEYPTILSELDNPILKAYSLETLIAEKFEAMISLGEYNSRMKDFYDIYKFVEETDKVVLDKAIENTFLRRLTKLTSEHPLFTEDFYDDPKRLKQWNLFINKNELDPVNFKDVQRIIASNLERTYQRLCNYSSDKNK